MATETMAPVPKTNGSVQPWDPFRFFQAFERDFGRFWHRPFFMGGGPWQVPFPMMATGKMTYTPLTDIYEKDGMLVFKADLPGLTKDDVEVEIVDGDLVIKGASATQKETSESDYYRMERTYGTFYRRLVLPYEVAPDQITATMNNGVLEVKIPWPAASVPPATKIPVS